MRIFLNAVHAMRFVSDRHINVCNYLQCRADREDESWWGIRPAQQTVSSLLVVDLNQFPVPPFPARRIVTLFRVGWT